WRALADYRYARFTENGVLQADSLRDSTIATAGEIDSTWRYGQNQFNVQLEFAPGNKLLVRPGIQYIKRDVTVLDGGLTDLTRTKRSKSVAPILSLYYMPGERFTIRGSVQSITNGTPYTRISPRTDVVGRSTARYRASDRVTIENSAIFRTGKY